MNQDWLKRLSQKQKQLKVLLPLPKTLAKSLEEWYRVELTYSSNAIEGNTLSRLETAVVLEHGISATISGKPLKDQLEALNHAEALTLIENLRKQRKGHQFITEEDIKTIHQLILKGIDDPWAGKYRQTEVFIRGSDAEFPLPQNVPLQMRQLIDWLSGEQSLHPVALAAELHYRFVSIHPFIDGNGRTARLLMNLILIMHKYPKAVIRMEERAEYLDSFEAARRDQNREPFDAIVAGAAERSLDAYIQAAQGKPVMPVLATSPTGELLKIGELAKKTDESVFTLRYWLKEGLLTVAEVTPAGYQLFSERMVERVKKIRQLQTVKRLTLEEIKIELGLLKGN